MREVAIWILAIYCLIQAFIVYYFFIYKQRQIDKQYQEVMEKIYHGKMH